MIALVALVGFAANSILCRLALGAGLIDAASFTGVRLGSGALVLALLARGRVRGGSWGSAVALFAYAIQFSFAYLRIGAAVGALVLFGAVQATMIGWGIRAGERPRMWEWIGLGCALGGLVLLTFPGLHAPDPLGTALMVGAGVAWGIYSLRGRGTIDPLAATAGNFVRTLPMTLAVSALTFHDAHVSSRGLLLAISSGALASGVGYSLWYAALRHLTATRAAIAQLSVPALAAAAATLLLHEPLSTRILVASAIILGGVGAAVVPARRAA